MYVSVSTLIDCDRKLSLYVRLETSKNIEVYRRAPSDSVWRVKSLIACALRRLGVPRCCSHASLSKRA